MNRKMTLIGVVAIVGFVVGLSRREMDRAGDFFVEENVLHRLGAIGIEANREFAHVSRAFV